MTRRVPLLMPFLLLFLLVTPLFGQEPPAPSAADQIKALQESLDKTNASITSAKVGADTLWVMITGMLVFFMNLGFACVESGFCRAKNCVNILSKNFIVFAATTVAFWLVGWGIMFGNGSEWVGKEGVWMVNGGVDNSPTIPAFAPVLQADVKESLGVDVTDADAKKANPKVVEAVDAAIEKFGATTSNTIDVKKDGKDVKEDNTLTVKIENSGKVFEKTYKTADYYWGPYSSIAWTGVPLWAKFFFQLVFAGTAATIVSGAVAERIKYHSFIVFSFIMAILIYPVVGHWVWGGGYLQAKLGFLDFAGSTQVHSIGGWAALAGIIILGPRIGKYGPGGKINAIPGHNLTAATIGCFVLWFGWFGFNPGSTMVVDGAAIAEVAITTNLAAAAATLTATITAWLLLGKPDLGMTLNGCLAGLVAITAPCAFVTAEVSLLIGAIAGVIVVFAVIMFDKLKLDDPVGATSVHLVNGVFGTLCVGLFAHPDKIGRAANPEAVAGLLYNSGNPKQLITQLIGAGLTAGYVFIVALIAWIVLKVTIGIRVSAEEETSGLDIGEHGNEAYHGFVLTTSDATAEAEPRAAAVPPGAEKRFSIVVEGVSNGELLHAWAELCQPKTGQSIPSFKAVYPYMTTVKGNRFTFRGGDPAKVREHIEALFKDRLKSPIKATVE